MDVPVGVSLSLAVTPNLMDRVLAFRRRLRFLGMARVCRSLWHRAILISVAIAQDCSLRLHKVEKFSLQIRDFMSERNILILSSCLSALALACGDRLARP